MSSLEHQQPIQNKNQSPPQVGTTIDDHFRQILPPLIYLLGVWGVAGTTPLILRQWLVLIQRESNNNNRRQVSACANTGLDVFDATLECTSLLLFCRYERIKVLVGPFRWYPWSTRVLFVGSLGV